MVVLVVCSWNFLKFRFFPVYQQEGCCGGGRCKGKGQPRKRPEQGRGYQGKYYNPNYNRDNNYNNSNNQNVNPYAQQEQQNNYQNHYQQQLVTTPSSRTAAVAVESLS